MEDVVKWIGGAALTICLAVVGYLVNAMKDLRAKQSNDNAGAHKRIDEIHRDYVRRDDFREYKLENRETLARIEEKIDRVGQQISKTG